MLFCFCNNIVVTWDNDILCGIYRDNALPFGIFEDLPEQSFIFLYAAFRKKISPSIYILLDLFIGYV